MNDPYLTKRLLVQLLRPDSPEFAARLKQRLDVAHVNSGLGRFDERHYGYRKFSEFLQQGFGDIIRIERPNGPGDVLVYLRAPANEAPTPNFTTKPQASLLLPKLRNDVWQAFSNPDPRRKRFLNRHTGVVRHYLEHEQCAAKEDVESQPEVFVEITPIDRSTQQTWMRQYLDTLDLPQDRKSALSTLLNEQYSSQLNATFTQALGPYGYGWRKYRTNQMLNCIQEWAKYNGVDFELLKPQQSKETQSSLDPFGSRELLDPRRQAQRLLELVEDEKIEELVIPNLLIAILVQARR